MQHAPYNLSEKDLLSQYKTTLSGLSFSQVQETKQKIGKNEIPKVKIPFFKKYIKPILNLMMLILLFAAGIQVYFALNDEETSLFSPVVILVILFINILIAMRQQYKAEKTLEALEKLTKYKATVSRDKEIFEIDANELVPGDILILKQGDYIAADARIILSNDLYTNESILTGESHPIHKIRSPIQEDGRLPIQSQTNMVFSSTFVVSGNGTAVVTATGINTVIGKITAGVAQKKHQEIPLNKGMNRLATSLGLLVLGVITVLFVVYRLQGGTNIIGELNWLISLAVAAIPINFPLLTTLILLTGVLYLSRNQVIVRNLNAIETIGRTSVICSDKTGTITQNEITVQEIYLDGKTYRVSGKGYGSEGNIWDGENIAQINPESPLAKLITTGFIDNNAVLIEEQVKMKKGTTSAYKVIGLPTEGSLMTLINKSGLNTTDIKEKHQILKEFSFTSKRKMMSKLVKNEAYIQLFSKGAPEIILKLCTQIETSAGISEITPETRREFENKIELYATQGYRTLAMAYRTFESGSIHVHENAEYDGNLLEQDLIFLGIVAMNDPIRDGVEESVKICHEAGIKVVLITGDHPTTAKSIAKTLNIYNEGDSIIVGREIDNCTTDQITNTNVFARVAPEDKNTIVLAYQEKGHIVSMTGDGVNDVIALENADNGISMGINGTDVAKNAADLILTDDSFNSIETAIYHGRGLFNNIRSNISFLLVCDLMELTILAVISFIFNQRVLDSIHLNLLYALPHFFFPLGLIFDKYDRDLLKIPPKKKNARLIGKNYLKMMGVQIFTISVGLILVWLVIQNEIFPVFSENYQDLIYTNPINGIERVGYVKKAGEFVVFSNGENYDLLLLYKAQTICFISLIFSEIWVALEARSIKKSIFKVKINLLLLFFILFVLGVVALLVFYNVTQSYLHFIILSPWDWCLAIGCSFLVILTTELWKKLRTNKDL